MKNSLVLVHGFRGAPEGLAELAEILRAGGYKVAVPALPPTGAELPAYEPKAYADFLAEYIKREKLEKPVLIGHSMGSIVVAAMAEQYPELIADRLLCLAPIIKGPPRLVVALSPLTSYVPNWLLSRITTAFLFAGGGKKLFKKCLKLTIQCGAEAGSKREQRKAAAFACRYGVADFDFTQRMLLILGKKDRLARVAQVKDFARERQGEVKVLEGCGHLLNYEKAEAVAEAIMLWLSKSEK